LIFDNLLELFSFFEHHLLNAIFLL